jgi:biotin transport system substrate-specific component
MGAPVFHAGTGGIAVLLGPTGGYLVGFLPAVCIMGLAARRLGTGRRGADGSTRSLASIREILVLTAGAVLAGATIYCFGVPWLSLFTGSSLSRAVAVGVVPFLLGDLLKTAVAVAAVRLGIGTLSRKGLLPF